MTKAYTTSVYTKNYDPVAYSFDFQGNIAASYPIVDMMKRDPYIIFGLAAIKGPLTNLTFSIKGNNEEASLYAQKLIMELWSHSSTILSCIDYGTACGEIIFVPDDKGRPSIYDVLPLMPQDVEPDICDGKLRGIRLQMNSSGFGYGRTVEPASQETGIYIPSPKCIHVTHDTIIGRRFGRSRVLRVFADWNLLNEANKGLKVLRALYCFKHVMRGKRVYVEDGIYPMGSQFEGRTRFDVAREMMEQARAGADEIHIKDPNGKRFIEVEDVKIPSSPIGLFDCVKEVENAMLLGMGVPPEIVRASETGSGFSGRAIPLSVFYGSLNVIAAEIATQIIRNNILKIVHHVYPDAVLVIKPMKLKPPQDFSPTEPTQETRLQKQEEDEGIIRTRSQDEQEEDIGKEEQEEEEEPEQTEELSMGHRNSFVPPPEARKNAEKVLLWKRDYPDEIKGMTEIGWRRAAQLASGGPISMKTVSRIARFERHRRNGNVAEEYKNTPWKDAGHVAWLGWGGSEGIDWARTVLARLKMLREGRRKAQEERRKKDASFQHKRKYK